MTRRSFLAGTGAVALGALVGCGTGPEPAPTPTPMQTQTQTPTPTPSPSSAPTSSATGDDDPLRPRFHFSELTTHLADPNGLVHVAGRYHLFHQSDGRWAHADSSDLVRWRRRPIALGHDALGQALSGSAVVDAGNTSGLFAPGVSTGLVAAYTSTAGGEAQSLAISADAGSTWTRPAGNPVIANGDRKDFRDPKVFWHAPTGSWVMVAATGQQVTVFGSTNLRGWSELSAFGAGRGLQSAVWECPDLFPVPVEGGGSRWVLTVSVGDSDATQGSTVQWFVGDFDGTTFHPDGPADRVRIVDAGQDFYAAQTWSDTPDDRRVWIGWMGNLRYPYELPTTPWKGVMSVPRTLALRPVGDDLALVQTPVAELASLRGTRYAAHRLTVHGEAVLALRGRSLDLTLVLRPGAGRSGVRLLVGATSYVEVGVDRPAHTLYVDRSRAGLDSVPSRTGGSFVYGLRRSSPLDPVPDQITLRILLDRTTVEVFDPTGRTLSLTCFPPADQDGVCLFSDGGAAQIESLVAYPMSSIWTS